MGDCGRYTGGTKTGLDSMCSVYSMRRVYVIILTSTDVDAPRFSADVLRETILGRDLLARKDVYCIAEVMFHAVGAEAGADTGLRHVLLPATAVYADAWGINLAQLDRPGRHGTGGRDVHELNTRQRDAFRSAQRGPLAYEALLSEIRAKLLNKLPLDLRVENRKPPRRLLVQGVYNSVHEFVVQGGYSIG
ncbi:hypothetical protein J6590_028359 [Homalodisca vitripennis]|nr:hypothetical protein J6590_028359 [Homalodisca vitripennis]